MNISCKVLIMAIGAVQECLYILQTRHPMYFGLLLNISPTGYKYLQMASYGVIREHHSHISFNYDIRKSKVVVTFNFVQFSI
jgi:hypothetical protein